MKEQPNKKRKRLRLVPLIIGVYAVLLGIGLMAAGLSGGVIGWIRAVVGIFLGGFGVYGVWEGVRDLFEQEKERKAPPAQYIFTDIEGKKSSNVTEESLKKGLGALAESPNGNVSLQILPPLFVPGIGQLEQILCFHRDEFWVLGCFLSKEGTTLVYEKNADLDLLKVVLEEIRSGVIDASWWADAEELEVRPEYPGERMQLLTIRGESWKDEHKFFSARDLELAVEGLEDGRYTEVNLQLGLAVLSIRQGLSKPALLEVRLYLWEKGYPGRPRIFERNGTAVQVKFWLVRIYNEGLWAEGEGWQEITKRKS